MKDYLTIKEASKQLKKHPATLRRWIRKRKLKATKLGGKYGVFLIDRNDLLEFMISELSSE
jgi:excisionase family DNA binding protein